MTNIIQGITGFAGTMLAGVVSLTGAFTFVAASALACGQSNGKKILAYSTIANLGLIIACAGMATPAAITAASAKAAARFAMVCFFMLSFFLSTRMRGMAPV